MLETRNALSELAKVMDAPVDMASIHDRGLVVLNARQFSAYQMAQRIVAVLAKVDSTYVADPVHNNICNMAYDALVKIRKIAEEGANNGKM